MEKSRIMRYLAYFTIVLMLLSVLPGGSLAAKGAPGQGNGNQEKYTGENAAGSDDDGSDSGDDLDDGEDSGDGSDDDSRPLQDRDRLRERAQDLKEERKLTREQLREQVQSQRRIYQDAKGNFLQVRKQIRAGQFEDPEREATREYLNASICYMIAHLENVRYNLNNSNGNGTEARIEAIDEQIEQLKEEQARIEGFDENSTLEDFSIATTSVRGVWNNAQKASLAGAGQTVSERIGEFLDKSEILSEKIEAEIEKLNESDVNTTELEEKLADYNALIASAEANKEAADAIYEDEDATPEELEEANEYLRDALSDINEANQIVKEIFEELKEYEIETEEEQEQLQTQEQEQEQEQLQTQEQEQEQEQEMTDEEDQEEEQEQEESDVEETEN